MKTIAIVNRKGGVGKTATAQALGAGISRRGFKVLYIDLDSQTNLTYSLQANADGIRHTGRQNKPEEGKTNQRKERGKA